MSSRAVRTARASPVVMCARLALVLGSLGAATSLVTSGGEDGAGDGRAGEAGGATGPAAGSGSAGNSAADASSGETNAGGGTDGGATQVGGASRRGGVTSAAHVSTTRSNAISTRMVTPSPRFGRAGRRSKAQVTMAASPDARDTTGGPPARPRPPSL